MSQSTPIDKLDTETSNNSDNNLVQKILADMNTGNHHVDVIPPNSPNAAAMHDQPRMVLQEPPINSTSEYTMDPHPATSHMIGNSNPQFEDFANMMGASYASPSMNMEPVNVPSPAKLSTWTYIADRMRAPIVVAALFFLLNLPVFRNNVMQLAPWAFRMGGELSMVGLLLLSLITGLLFAGYQLLSDILGV